MLDLSDLQVYFSELSLLEYNIPFKLIFLEAKDPDDACYEIIHKIMISIIKKDNTINGRIICRKVRKYLRIDKIYAL